MSCFRRAAIALLLLACLLIDCAPQIIEASKALQVAGRYDYADDDDDNFELEAIPLEDAYDLLTTTERRPPSASMDDNRTFGVIVDCGSSGTRAHLYEWDGALEYPELLHHIEPMRGADRKPLSRKFSPSLSSFADDSREELETYIKQVLDYIESYIPRKSHQFTGVYILATAGMRLLDEQTQARIMADLASFIKREYNFAKVKTSVISGAHEGMYQWISVNAKARRFLGQGTSGRTKTFAVIEMGGASIQVTYQLRPGMSEVVASSMIVDEDARGVYRAQIVEPQLSRHDKPENIYLLHSTTFLGFGSNSAREAYLDLLIHKHASASGWHKFMSWSAKMLKSCFKPKTKDEDGDHDDEHGEEDGGESKVKQKGKDATATRSKKDKRRLRGVVIDDPCSPSGFVTETPLRKPKRLLENMGGRILGYLLDEDEPYFEFSVRGTGNYGKCKRLVEEMLKLAKRERLNCKPEDPIEECTMLLIGENFIPQDSVDYLGIGDIYYTTNLMLRSAGTYDHDRVARRTRKICSTPYRQLTRQFTYLYEDPKLRSRLSDECFKAVWVDTFLVKGLSMATDSSMLKTVGQINNDDLEWTLGAVLDKSLAIEEAAEENAEQIYNAENQGGVQDETTTTTTTTTTAPHDADLPAEDDELDLGLDDD